MSFDSYVNCSYCDNYQCVDKQVGDMERQNKDLQETHCNKCGMVITVIMSMMGVRCLETLIAKQKGVEI